MTPFATVLPRPRGRAAALLAAVAGVSIAVAVLVPTPREQPRQVGRRCFQAGASDDWRDRCQPRVYVMDLERRFVDPKFAHPPPPRGGCRDGRDQVDRAHEREHRRGPHPHRVPNVPAIRGW